jgi:hypothetical protein
MTRACASKSAQTQALSTRSHLFCDPDGGEVSFTSTDDLWLPRPFANAFVLVHPRVSGRHYLPARFRRRGFILRGDTLTYCSGELFHELDLVDFKHVSDSPMFIWRRISEKNGSCRQNSAQSDLGHGGHGARIPSGMAILSVGVWVWHWCETRVESTDGPLSLHSMRPWKC